MSEAIRDPERCLQTWNDALEQVLEEISATPTTCALSLQAPADLAPPSETDLWIVGTCLGALRGEMSLRCSAASTIRLAEIFTNGPATVVAETGPEHHEAVLELMRQAGGLVASALKQSWGELQLRLDLSRSAPSWLASSTAWLQLGTDPLTAPVIEIQLSAALVAELRAEASERTQPVPAESTAGTAVLPAGPNPGNLDLLMDVKLALALRFGSRRMLLREVLDLNPGAVVELDRQVEEPVDILLDGRIVARGEVVVLDGNYGLRVTEVVPTTP